MTRARAASLLLAAFAPIGATAAQSVDDMVEQARLSLAAWECSAFAQDQREVERLFFLGYESGKAFLEMLVKNPLDSETRRRRLPMAWTQASGPSADFVLGVVHSTMMEHALLGLPLDIPARNAEKLHRYEERNCVLLGR